MVPDSYPHSVGNLTIKFREAQSLCPGEPLLSPRRVFQKNRHPLFTLDFGLLGSPSVLEDFSVLLAFPAGWISKAPWLAKGPEDGNSRVRLDLLVFPYLGQTL